MKKYIKNVFKYISLIYFISLGSFLIYNTIQSIRDQPKQEELLKALKKEFSLIKKLSDSKVESEKYIAYTDKTSVSIDYSTDLQDNEIQLFYNSELKKNGWKLIEQHKVYDWCRDLGGQSFTYSKSNLRLTIEYAGDRAGAGWAYSIYLSLKKT